MGYGPIRRTQVLTVLTAPLCLQGPDGVRTIRLTYACPLTPRVITWGGTELRHEAPTLSATRCALIRLRPYRFGRLLQGTPHPTCTRDPGPSALTIAIG